MRDFTAVKGRLRLVVTQLTVAIHVSRTIIDPRPRQNLWVGDSHALFISGSPRSTVSASPNHKDLCFWLGPRLAFSIARSGWSLPPSARLIIRLRRFRRLIIALGEIDCRIYLGRDNNADYRDETWVNTFVEMASSLAIKTRVKELILLSPVPPSDLGEENADFPRHGTLASRVEGTEWFTENVKLHSSTHSFGKVIVLRQVLGKKDGSLDPRFTDDGVHVNQEGRRLIQNFIIR